jgi:hypothetical protein
MRFLKSKPLNISILMSETNFVTLELIIKSYGNNQKKHYFNSKY